MAEPQPDFRKMTPEDLKEGISTLNKLIKDLKVIQKNEDKRFAVATGSSALSTALITIVFPPAGLIMATTSAILNVDPTMRAIVARQTLEKAEDLRQKFKTVYRARPGRAFHDVAARREREKTRKKKNRKFHFPGFGRK